MDFNSTDREDPLRIKTYAVNTSLDATALSIFVSKTEIKHTKAFMRKVYRERFIVNLHKINLVYIN